VLDACPDGALQDGRPEGPRGRTAAAERMTSMGVRWTPWPVSLAAGMVTHPPTHGSSGAGTPTPGEATQRLGRVARPPRSSRTIKTTRSGGSLGVAADTGTGSHRAQNTSESVSSDGSSAESSPTGSARQQQSRGSCQQQWTTAAGRAASPWAFARRCLYGRSSDQVGAQR
jgi:hypothetical protein